MSERSSHWQLQTIVSQLRGARDQWRTRNGRLSGEHGGRELPSREAVAQILEALCGALFPMRLGPHDLLQESEDFYVAHTLDAALHRLQTQIALELRYTQRSPAGTEEQAQALSEAVATFRLGEHGHVARLVQERVTRIASAASPRALSEPRPY